MAYYCDIVDEYVTGQSGAIHAFRWLLGGVTYVYSVGTYVPVNTVAELGNLQSDVIGHRGYIVAETASAQSGAVAVVHTHDIVGEVAYVVGENLNVLHDLFREQATLQSGLSSHTTSVFAEQALLSSGATNTAHLSNTVSETAQVSGGLVSLRTNVVAETASLQSSAAQFRVTSNTLAETAALQSGVSAQAAFSRDVLDTAVLQSGITARLHARNVLAETAFIYGEAVLPPVGRAWSASTDTFGMSRYSNYPIISMAVVDGVLVGITDNGLYRLDGDTDNGADIDCSLTTGKKDFDGQELKTVPAVYVGLANDGAAYVTTKTTSVNGDPEEFTYAFDRTRAADANARAVPGKGLRSRYWQFTFSNANGGHLALNDAAADVSISTRRV